MAQKKPKTFTTDSETPHTYEYEIESWVREGEHPRRRARISEDDLPHVDFMVIKTIPEGEPTDVGYVTVWGPLDDWEFLEGILAYDYGDEGSLGIGAAA